MDKIPLEFRKYFWDVDIAKINPDKHQTYIIERLLEHGDSEAYRWLKSNFPREKIKEVGLKSRRIGQKTKNFLQLVP